MGPFRSLIAASLAMILTGCAGAKPPAPAEPPPLQSEAPAPPQSEPPKAAPVEQPRGDCLKGPYQPYAPAKPSPVKARVFVKEDPGIAAPIDAWVGALPITVVVRFSGPVDRAGFNPAVADTRCDYQPGPVEQMIQWISDTEAEITVKALPHGKPGPYTVTFGRGKDLAGLELAEERFSFMVRDDVGITVSAVPVGGGAPKVLFSRAAHLQARSVSPDGRYLLLVRTPWANANSHSMRRVPYIADLQTGELRAYSQGEVLTPRWDLANRALWVNGYQRLSLDGPGDTGQTLLERLPKAEEILAGAQVSPDGRWLAALRTDGNDKPPKAHLYVVDLQTGQVQQRRHAFGYPTQFEGPLRLQLSWAPDSLSFMVDDYYDGVSHPTMVDVKSLEAKPLDLKLPPGTLAGASPTGKYLVAYGVGLFTWDGRLVRQKAMLGGAWSAGDRYLWNAGSNGWYWFEEAETGKETRGPIPPEVERGLGAVFALSADGSTLYVEQRMVRK